MTGRRALTAPVPALVPTRAPEPWQLLGPVRLERVVPERDASLLHAWLTHPASHYWDMDRLSVDEVLAYERGVERSAHEHAWLGHVAGVATFVVETYDPAHVLLTDVHDARPGDLGMHLLVAPPTGRRVTGLTDAVMAATLRFCFGELRAARVVVEPDLRNTAIAAKNAAAGFRVLREVDLPGKRAALSVCTRADFTASRLGATSQPATHPATACEDSR